MIGNQRFPKVHLVTDPALLRSRVFERHIEPLLATGGDRVALHLRGHGLCGRDLWRCAELSAAAAAEHGGLLIVNDRIDIAFGCGAGGVQLGASSFPIDRARTLIGPDRLIGASIHSPSEAVDAVRLGADFLLVGTLYESASHPGRRGRGLSWVSQVVDLGVPVIGIGGITTDRIGEVLAAGATGVAAIRSIWGAERPVEALRAFLVETKNA